MALGVKKGGCFGSKSELNDQETVVLRFSACFLNKTTNLVSFSFLDLRIGSSLEMSIQRPGKEEMSILKVQKSFN